MICAKRRVYLSSVHLNRGTKDRQAVVAESTVQYKVCRRETECNEAER